MTEGFDNAAYVQRALAASKIIDGVPHETPLIPIEKVGIIGAGTMGGGIAMNYANIGLRVHLVETRQDALDRGIAVIRGHYQRSASRGRFPFEEVDVRMARISGSTDMTDLSDCDLIIEAVFEDMKLKKDIFGRLDQIAKPGAILASNTSALDLNDIATATQRPEAVIGLHFASPANVMKMLEIVRGEKTSETVLATSMAMATEIGKNAVVVGVCHGFVGNRMLILRQEQAQALLKQGTMPWDIDRVIKQFGFKMGPFEMGDLAGLDVGWVPGEGDPFRDALCKAGRRGQKTLAGYYDYDENRVGVPSAVVADIIRSVQEPTKRKQPASDEEILELSLFPMVNEGARILEEGFAQRASDIDVILLSGYGWPENTGGPMRWADTIGLDRILNRMRSMGNSEPRYRPAPLLERLVAEGGRFTDR